MKREVSRPGGRFVHHRAMVLLSVVLALLLEQLRPLPWRQWWVRRLRRWAAWVARHVDTGQGVHAWLGWALAVLGPGLLVALVHGLLKQLVGWPVAWLWSVLVLHLGLGLQQLGQQGMQLRDALELGDEAQARRLLARWRQLPVGQLLRTGLTCQVLEQVLLAAHRQVFGVLFWFGLLAAWGLGPAGVVVYRQSERLARHWQRETVGRHLGVSPALGRSARRAWQVLDAVPARLTALGFALVGRFEAALQAWREHAGRFASANDGAVLASGAGALGVALGTPLEGWPDMSGVAPKPGHVRNALALVWRLLGVWLLLLVLLTLAHALG